MYGTRVPAYPSGGRMAMTYQEMEACLEREKELVARLGACLEEELGYILAGDVEELEESLPEKQRLMHTIAENREGMSDPAGEPSRGQAQRIRGLQQDLAGSWTRVRGLNESARELVTKRLSEVRAQLEPFFAGLQTGYDRSGKKARLALPLVRKGV